MNERKNINTFFQEKFNEFEVEPNEIVWNNIEKKLKEKKKRRIIPFWWKFSGIAATLVLGIFVFNNRNDFKISKKHNSVAIENNLKKSEKQNQEIVSNEKIKNIENVDANKTSSEEKNNTVSKIISTEKTTNYKNNTSDEIVLQTKNNENKKLEKSNSKYSINSKKHNSSEIALQPSKLKNKKSEKSNSAITNKENNEVVLNEKKLKNIEPTSKNETINSVVNNKKSDSNDIKKLEKSTPEITNKKLDSTKIVAVELNAMEKLLNEKEKKQQNPKQKLNRWQVSPNIAPIYFSSTSAGSSLDEKLINNPKSYNANNVSYGIGGSFAVNKKIKIRAGVNKFSSNYVTNGIVYYQTNSVEGKIENLNLNIAGSSIIIESISNVNSTFGKIQDKQEGSLNQKLGYIEVPLEISYKLLDKKFGIDVIGGMSTMFLNENGVYLQSSDLNLKIGEANNINNVHYSTNIGLGLKYGFMKNIEARVEPIFKYQINTFSSDANNFKPYIIGVYSGISYSF